MEVGCAHYFDISLCLWLVVAFGFVYLYFLQCFMGLLFHISIWTWFLASFRLSYSQPSKCRPRSNLFLPEAARCTDFQPTHWSSLTPKVSWPAPLHVAKFRWMDLGTWRGSIAATTTGRNSSSIWRLPPRLPSIGNKSVFLCQFYWPDISHWLNESNVCFCP